MDMTKGSPTSLLLRFAMPLFLGNLLQQFYNLVDTSIAGNLLGDGALAQIGATAALYSLITNFAFGMNNGLALGVSRNFGAGDQQGMQHLKAPLICSTLELIGKVIFAIWLVPVWGYIAVCICEPVTWVICCAFIVGAAVVFRKEFQTAE